jgi:hypothetical protein
MTSQLYFCFVIAFISSSASGLSLPKIFGNEMVLQAAPYQAQVPVSSPTLSDIPKSLIV